MTMMIWDFSVVSRLLRMLFLCLSFLLGIQPAHAGWEPTISPYGASIYCLASSNGNLYAGTYNRGIFRSTDNGESWTQIDSGLTETKICSLVTSSNDVYAGTYNGGVFLSTDAGSHWSIRKIEATDKDVRALVLGGTDLFAGTYGDGVFRSTDQGTSWDNMSEGLSEWGRYVFSLVTIGPRVIAGTYDGIFLSSNGGDSWSKVGDGMVKALAADGANVYAGCGWFVATSRDSGTTWDTTTVGLAHAGIRAFALDGSTIYAGSGEQAYDHGYGVYRSTDNGSSWVQIGPSLVDVPIAAITKNGASIVAGSLNRGIYLLREDGSDWTAMNTGMSDWQGEFISCLASIGNNLLAGSLKSLFLSTDGGSSWMDRGLYFGGVRQIVSRGSNVYSAGNNHVNCSSDYGFSWTVLDSGWTDDYAFLVAANDTFLFGTGYSQLFRASNEGRMVYWEKVGGGFPTGLVMALGVSGPNVFASVLDVPGMYISTDNGKMWTHDTASFGAGNVLKINVSDQNVFATRHDGKVMRFSDDGRTWTLMTGLPEMGEWNEIVVENQEFFAATDSAVLFSLNGGLSWNRRYPEEDITGARSLLVWGTKIFAGTVKGIYSRTVEDLVSVRSPNRGIPTAIHLAQNFPNPFNPKTIIEYETPDTRHVKLTVYDVLGREVAVLVNAIQQPGSHRVQFDGSHLASGVYFYRMEAGTFVETKRLVLIR